MIPRLLASFTPTVTVSSERTWLGLSCLSRPIPGGADYFESFLRKRDLVGRLDQRKSFSESRTLLLACPPFAKCQEGKCEDLDVYKRVCPSVRWSVPIFINEFQQNLLCISFPQDSSGHEYCLPPLPPPPPPTPSQSTHNCSY